MCRYMDIYIFMCIYMFIFMNTGYTCLQYCNDVCMYVYKLCSVCVEWGGEGKYSNCHLLCCFSHIAC